MNLERIWSASIVCLLLLVVLQSAGCSEKPGTPTCLDDRALCAGSATCNQTTGRCEAEPAAADCTGSAVCGTGTSCDDTSGRCVGAPGDCRIDPNVCESGTACDSDTGRCTAEAADCRIEPGLCEAGTTCNQDTGRCTAEAADCRTVASLCGEGSTCDESTGFCVAPAADCRGESDLCGTGTVCDEDTGRCGPAANCTLLPGICGERAVCGSDGVCRADCRLNIAGTCGNGMLCNPRSGACEQADVLDCRLVEGLCWEDQTCEDDTGYCREAKIDLAQPYDVQVYDLELNLLTASAAFEAKLDLYFVATRADTDAIVLDAGTAHEVEGSTYVPYTVTSVTDSTSADLEFVQDATQGTLRILLGTPLEVGDGEVLTITYDGAFNPIEDDSDPFFYAGLMQRSGKDGTPVVMTFGWPDLTRRWLPSHDHPSDAARFRADVGIDTSLMVLANGLLVKEAQVDGLNRRTFVLRQPVPTYALSITAANYVKVPLGVVDGVSVDAYTYAADAHVPRRWWAGTTGALQLFNATLGAYPFETYGVVEFPAVFGGMEHATLVSIADTQLDAKDHGSHVVVHELVHHWFGDSARQSSWEEFWLNESLATFYDAEHRRVMGGEAGYREYLESRRALMFKYAFLMDGHPLRYAFTEETVPSFSDSTGYAPYYKGPWVWHMLRVKLGEAKFAEVMARFAQSTRLGRYDTAGLMDTVKDVSGEDHSGFFAEWVHQAGWPQLEYSWSYDPETETITVKAAQVQDVKAHGTYTFEGPLALGFQFDDEDPTTGPCQVKVTMGGGETEGGAEEPCSFEPSRVSTPFTRDLLIQLP